MTESSNQYYVSKAPAPLRGLDYALNRIKNWFLALSGESRCYVIGLAVLVLGVVMLPFKKAESGVLFQLGALVFALGLLPLIERLYEWVWQKLLGKLISAALIALATNLAYGIGRQMVAGLVGASPEPFTGTVNVATILLSPVLFLMVLAIGGIFFFGVAICFVPLVLFTIIPPVPHAKLRQASVWICRCIAISIIVFGSWGILNRSNGYTDWVARKSASYLYTFDMYYDTQYANGKGEKMAFLTDGRQIIGVPDKSGGYVFEMKAAGVGRHKGSMP